MRRPHSTGHRQAIGRASRGTTPAVPADALAHTMPSGLSWPPTAEDLDTVEVVAIEPAAARAPKTNARAAASQAGVTFSAPAVLIDPDDAEALAFATEADLARPPRRRRFLTASRRARQALLAAAVLLLAWPLADMVRTGLQPELQLAAVPPGLVLPAVDLMPAVTGRPEAVPEAAVPVPEAAPRGGAPVLVTPPRPPLSQPTEPSRQVSRPSSPGQSNPRGPESRLRVEESPAPAAPVPAPPVRPDISPPASAVPAPGPVAGPAPTGPAPLSARGAADVGEPAARPPMTTMVSDEAHIQATLRRYEAAYGRLDARAAQSVWPSVDARALARAFDGLDSQTLQIERCDVQVRGALAEAACQGSTTYVRRVGSKTPRTEARQWSFRLEKVDEQWQIQTARIR
jgi:hypothetical protein